MIKRPLVILAILAALVFTAAAAQAAAHFKGTIRSARGDTLVVQVVTPDLARVKWVEEGQEIEIDKKLKADIIAVDKDARQVTVVLKKAVKAGDRVDIRKSRKSHAREVMSGC